MLQQLTGDDDVEALVRELEGLVEVGPVCLDPELRRLRQRLAVGVDADDVISLRIRPGERAVAATQVEHAAAGPADVLPEERLALRPREDESRAPLAAVVLGVPLAQLLQAHEGRLEQAGSTLAPVSTKPAARPVSPPPEQERSAPVEDIRSARPYLFSRASLVAVARRLASVTALVLLDLGGLVLGIYVALIVRELYLGQWPPLWGILWSTESDWLPFLTVITVLVFWVGGLYRRRELRAGLGQIVFSLMLVAVITLAFGLGTGYHFTTYGLTPTALVLTAFFVGVLRASYDVLTRDVLQLAGVRRRAILVGEGDQLAELRRSLGSGRSGIRYEFIGAVAPSADTGTMRSLGGFDA